MIVVVVVMIVMIHIARDVEPHDFCSAPAPAPEFAF